MGYLSFSQAVIYSSATAKKATVKTIMRRSVIAFRD
jgi:hypothetical protein